MPLADYADWVDCIKLVWADFFANELGCTVSVYLYKTIIPTHPPPPITGTGNKKKTSEKNVNVNK